MQHVPITYILSLAHSFDDHRACLTYFKHAGCPSDRHRVKPKANMRACEGRETERERESNKQSGWCVYSSCIRGNWWGPASPFSSAGVSLDHLAFTPQSQLSHLKPSFYPHNPHFFLSSSSSLLFFTMSFLQIWLDAAGKGRGGQKDERILHKWGGEWRIDHVRKARDE